MRGKSKAIINSRETKFVQDKMYKHDLVGKKKKMYILSLTEIPNSHFMKILI